MEEGLKDKDPDAVVPTHISEIIAKMSQKLGINPTPAIAGASAARTSTTAQNIGGQRG